MPQIHAPNVDARYYAHPSAFRATVGAAAITAFPAPATPAALQSLTGTQASATLAFAGQPADKSTIAINGVTITFLAAGTGGFSLATALLNSTALAANGVSIPFQGVGPYGLQVAIGLTLASTLANLLALLRAWPDEALQALHHRLTAGNTLLISSRFTGTAGNAIALVSSAGANVAVTPSGGSTTAAGTAATTTLGGGSAPTPGYAVLVEPQPHPVEITYAAGICRASQTAGTMTLFLSDGTTITKCPKGTVTFTSANALSTSQENSPMQFSAITAVATLVVPPWTGLYAYSSTTQIIDIEAGPGGSY